jgi:cyclophilin family peptidyl-prolyl cis-trans isomerase
MSGNDEWAAVGGPIRCELVPLTEFLPWSRPQYQPAGPPLILDMGPNGAIQLTDPATKALVASTWLAEVTATPARFYARGYVGGDGGDGYRQPVLIVDVPGLQPLRIVAAYHTGSLSRDRQYRYVWRGRARPMWESLGAKKPNYEVTEAEWLTLVQTFSLGSRVVDDVASGKLERRERRNTIVSTVFLALIVIAIVAGIIYHYATRTPAPARGRSTGQPPAFVLSNTDQYPAGDPELSQPVRYPRGTLAMANTGPGTNGSQFYLVYKDSPLPPNYTVFGTIDQAGLATLDKIASAGVAGGAQDGAPSTPVEITSVRLG